MATRHNEIVDEYVILKSIKTFMSEDLASKIQGLEFDGDTIKLDTGEAGGDEDYITFDDLRELADIMHTEHVDLQTYSREGGYCETCAYSYTTIIISFKYSNRAKFFMDGLLYPTYSDKTKGQ
jgi:hypothetical protein